MAVTTIKTKTTSNNLQATLLLPFIIAFAIILTLTTNQNITENRGSGDENKLLYKKQTLKRAKMAVITTKTNPTNNNLPTTLLLPFIIALTILLTYQNIKNQTSYNKIGAGARELASKATKDKDKTTQQAVSTLIGAAVGKGTGASVALKGEKFNRQLHQKEIEWIKKHSLEFAKELYGANPTKI